jgi:hypothetical protein
MINEKSSRAGLRKDGAKAEEQPKAGICVLKINQLI